jgi:hypothetical protein
MKNICIFCGHLEYILAIWYVIWPFSNLLVFWYIYPQFGILYHHKSGNPAEEYRMTLLIEVAKSMQ